MNVGGMVQRYTTFSTELATGLYPHAINFYADCVIIIIEEIKAYIVAIRS